MMTIGKSRFPELDALRGLAVLMMVFYHLLFDLSFYGGWTLDVTTPFWTLFAHATAAIFLVVIGICFVISWERTPTSDRLQKTLRRAGIVFGSGMLVTLATLLIVPSSVVVFGILHLIGVSALLEPAFRTFRRWNVLVGIAVILFGQLLPSSIDSFLLLPFGIPSHNFVTLDYYPLLPWFGFILVGMGLGDHFYIPNQKPVLQSISSLHYPRWLLWTGRRALLIYFVHQPLILFALYLI